MAYVPGPPKAERAALQRIATSGPRCRVTTGMLRRLLLARLVYVTHVGGKRNVHLNAKGRRYL